MAKRTSAKAARGKAAAPRGNTRPAPRKASRKRSRPVAAALEASRPPAPVTLAEAEKLSGVAGRVRRAVTELVAAAAVEDKVVPRDIATVRKRLQKQEDRELAQRIRDYKATMAILERRGVAEARVAPAEFAGRESIVPLAQPHRPLRVMAEGDSWFNYPPFPIKGGLVKRLKGLLGVPILDLSKAGDEVRNMLGVEQRMLIAKHLSDGSPAGGQWDCFLFSGGGNDIVGNPMALWINPYVANATPVQLVNQPRFNAALAIIRAGYEDLISLRDQLSPNTELVFHSYDYAIPDGRGVCGYGPWMWPSFAVRGFPSTAVAFPVVKEMLRQFATMLAQIANRPGVTFVNTQNTLSPVVGSWHNELHPSDAGYDQVANVIYQRLRVRFP